jgi:AcrR family transcriptional regulator
VDLDGSPGSRRRRGAELEHALLQAAYDELVARGYADLTFESVASRAGTSRPVLYRRWGSKPELVRAAVEHVLARERAEVPDTGTLRGDLIAVMRFANQNRIELSVLLTYHLGPYFRETGTTPAQLRGTMFGDRMSVVDAVIDRAIERGEVDADRMTPRLRSLPFDLYRNEAVMNLAPVPDEVIESVLDEVFLPLVLR